MTGDHSIGTDTGQGGKHGYRCVDCKVWRPDHGWFRYLSCPPTSAELAILADYTTLDDIQEDLQVGDDGNLDYRSLTENSTTEPWDPLAGLSPLDLTLSASEIEDIFQEVRSKENLGSEAGTLEYFAESIRKRQTQKIKEKCRPEREYES